MLEIKRKVLPCFAKPIAAFTFHSFEDSCAHTTNSHSRLTQSRTLQCHDQHEFLITLQDEFAQFCFFLHAHWLFPRKILPAASVFLGVLLSVFFLCLNCGRFPLPIFRTQKSHSFLANTLISNWLSKAFYPAFNLSSMLSFVRVLTLFAGAKAL